MTWNCVVALQQFMNFGVFFIKHTQNHIGWSNKMKNNEQSSPAFMYKWFSCFKTGIKAIDGDFTSNHSVVELCSIKNCEKWDDSAENISKIDSGRCITKYICTDTGQENLLQKNGQTHEMRRYCWCSYRESLIIANRIKITFGVFAIMSFWRWRAPGTHTAPFCNDYIFIMS